MGPLPGQPIGVLDQFSLIPHLSLPWHNLCISNTYRHHLLLPRLHKKNIEDFTPQYLPLFQVTGLRDGM